MSGPIEPAPITATWRGAPRPSDADFASSGLANGVRVTADAIFPNYRGKRLRSDRA